MEPVVFVELAGEIIHHIPASLAELAHCRPVYEVLPGWEEDIMGVRRLADLPANARHYVDFVQEKTGVTVSYVSVGPGRAQFIPVS